MEVDKGDYKLYKGDCLEVMDRLIEEGAKFDLILTDPPYELDNHGKGKNDFKDRKLVKDNHIGFMSNGFDYNDVFDKMLKLQYTPNILIFCSNKQISKIMSYFESKKLSCTLLIWNKSNPIPLCNGKYVSDVEFIVYVRGKKAPFNNGVGIKYKYKVKKYPTVNAKQRFHPSEKPVALLEELINLHSFEGQKVLDCFMGSGSTGVACINTNREFTGIELDEKYFDISIQRLENLV